MDDAPSQSSRTPKDQTLVVAGTPAEVRKLFPRAEALLTTVELERARAFRGSTDLEAFVAVHALARVVVAELVGASPDTITVAQRCEQCGGPHGKPIVVEHPEISVNWSHAQTYVAAAAGSEQVAVDVEGLHPPGYDERVAAHVLTPDELVEVRRSTDPAHAFLHHWVRKECCVKLGLAELDDLPVEPDLAGWVTTHWRTADAIGCVIARTHPEIRQLDHEGLLAPNSGAQLRLR